MDRSLRRNVGVLVLTLLTLKAGGVRAELLDQAIYLADDPFAAAATADIDSVLRVSALTDTSLTAEALEPGCAAPVAADCGLDACSSCGSCGCCGDCCQSRYWFAGVEATFLAPNLSGNGARFTTVDPFTGASTVVGRAGSSVDDNLYVAPRIWIGLQGECWGLVGRYWQLDASEIYFDPFSDTAGYISQDRLDVYTVDLELTRRFFHRCSVWNLGVGVRHAGFDHDTTVLSESLLGAQSPSDPSMTSLALASSQFNGTGITLGLGGYRPLHSTCHYCVNLFWNLRGSVLWGNVRNVAEGRVDVSGSFGSLSLAEISAATSEEEMFIGELQVGLRWDHQMHCVPLRAFFQVAAEYQHWDANSTGTGFDGVFDVVGVGTGYSSISASDARMDLYGFSIGTGCMW